MKATIQIEVQGSGTRQEVVQALKNLTESIESGSTGTLEDRTLATNVFEIES